MIIAPKRMGLISILKGREIFKQIFAAFWLHTAKLHKKRKCSIIMTTWNFCPDIYIQKVLLNISFLLSCQSFVSFQSLLFFQLLKLPRAKGWNFIIIQFLNSSKSRDPQNTLFVLKSFLLFSKKFSVMKITQPYEFQVIMGEFNI